MPRLARHLLPMADGDLGGLLASVRGCTVCLNALPHGVRPIVQAGSGARIVIIGQAPGSRVHASGVPWDDDSGERLRGWLGMDRAVFYDPDRVALVPMGLCYPGRGKGGDLPPRKECAPLWHGPLLAAMPNLRLMLLVGQYAQKAYLPVALRLSLTEAVRAHAAMPDGTMALPHPAWRVRMWMARHPWFDGDVLPALRERVAAAFSRAEGSQAGGG